MRTIVSLFLAWLGAVSPTRDVTYTAAVSASPMSDVMGVSGTPSQSYVGKPHTLDVFMSDAQLSATLSTALGVPMTAVATTRCTVVILYENISSADAHFMAMRLAAVVGVENTPFQTTARDVRFIVPHSMGASAAAAAMGYYSAVGAAHVVCIDMHVGDATSSTDIKRAMAVLPWHIAAIVDHDHS